LTGLLNSQGARLQCRLEFLQPDSAARAQRNKRWPTGFDLNRLTAGSSKEVALHAGTNQRRVRAIRQVPPSEEPAVLRWRGRRSLGWVPLKGRDLKREGEAFRFAGNTFRVFHSRPLPDGKIKDGTNFSCDTAGVGS